MMASDTKLERQAAQAISFLRSPGAIRERCHALLEHAVDDGLEHFSIDESRLPAVVERVLELTRRRYPNLDIPFHSRFRHFGAGGRDRIAELTDHLASRTELDRSRALVELVIVSVLLDAGAGARYRYHERRDGSASRDTAPVSGSVAEFARSEALAVASYDMFVSGWFSSDPMNPCSVDARGLAALTSSRLSEGFQVSAANPIVGLEGRLALLSALGKVIETRDDVFGRARTNDGAPGSEPIFEPASEPRRLGLFFDNLMQGAERAELSAARVLDRVLDVLGPIWPGRIFLGRVNLGDVFRHPKAGGAGLTAGLVPFHKLSQWLTYSLLEALSRSSVNIAGVDELTGLAEYRNGGLLIDMGMIQPKRREILADSYTPSAEVVVEWRALTVALLDKVADGCREALGLSSVELPLAKILEGGTWAAGREIAYEMRPDGSPPIRIESDGTVF